MPYCSKIGQEIRIGDFVQCDGDGLATFEGYFRGQSTDYPSCWVIERLDDYRGAGGGQNGWWNFKKDASSMRIIRNNNNIKTIMSTIKTKIKLALIGEPQKTLVKAGILNDNKELTSEGQEAFNDFLYEKFGDEFATKVAPLVKEDDKE